MGASNTPASPASRPEIAPVSYTHLDVYKRQSYARRITANGPFAVRKTKESVLRGLAVDMKEAYRIESAISSEVFSSDDAVEGPRAFAEKRVPQWTNR